MKLTKSGMFDLLVIQISWPPQSHPFIERRLRALADLGMMIIVATSTNGSIDKSLLPFTKIVRLPHAAETKLIILARTLRDTFWALGVAPGRVWRLVRQGRNTIDMLNQGLWWWANSIPFLRLSPRIVHFEWNSAAIIYKWLPGLLGCHSVVSCRGRQINIVPFLPGKEDYLYKLKQSFQIVDAVHCVSQHILEQACQLGLDRAKGHVIYTAVDTDFFKIGPPNVKAPIIIKLITVGAAMWRKGYEYLLLTIKYLVEFGHQVHLSIVDDEGPECDRIIFTVKDLGLEQNVRMLGRLSAEGVRNALWCSDIFLLASLSEGLSNAVVEAMACGLPVVVTECGGMREAVTDGVEGFVVPTRDPNSMAHKIIMLIENPELRIKMGQAGFERVRRQFTLERQAQEFFSLYLKVIEEHKVG